MLHFGRQKKFVRSRVWRNEGLLEMIPIAKLVKINGMVLEFNVQFTLYVPF